MLLSDIKEGAQARKRKKSKDKAAPDPAKKTKKAATPARPEDANRNTVAKHDKYGQLDSKRHQSDPEAAQAASLGP